MVPKSNHYFNNKNNLIHHSNLKEANLTNDIKNLILENNKNRRKNILISNIFQIKNIIIIFILLIINLNILIISNDALNQFQFSKIILKIRDIGKKNVLSNSFSATYYPDEVYINGYKQSTIKNSYDFNETDNIIELRWNKTNYNCDNMFNGCSDITEMDLSNFNTSLVTLMCNMFYGCSSLTSMNFNNFHSLQVTHMHDLFSGCTSLTSLNLSNFDISKVTWMDNLFYGCEKLEYINIQNFKEIQDGTFNNMFEKVPDNLVICLDENNIRNKILPQIQKLNAFTIDCTNDWKLNQKKMVNKSGICTDINGNDIIFKYEQKGKYYEDILNGNLINHSTIKNCKCNSIKCLSCPKVALINQDFCLECNKNYYRIENDISNIEEYINCYKEPKGYYFDSNESIYKKCYYTCDACEKKGNNITHNCLLCNNNFPLAFHNNNNYSNCYQKCKFYYYFDKYNNYQCTINPSCPEDYPKLLEDKLECIKYDIKNIIQNIPKFEKNETKQGKEEEIKYYDNVLKAIESGFTSENFDTSFLDEGEDEVIETEKIRITLTTTQNQINNKNDNITSIYLGLCETLLKNFYNISDDKLLYMKKIDVVQEGLQIPKVEFDIYCKLNESNLIKLNLSICEDSKISLSVPVKISGDIDKLNSSGEYYNDICSKSTSESGTDITLKDRQKEFVEGNKTVCQDDCNFFNYDNMTQKANCSCKIKESSSSVANMTINKTKLYENFDDVSNKNGISNLEVTSCNVLGSKENIISNTAFFLLLIILAIFIIIFILFYTKGYNSLENKIDEVIKK